MKNEKVNIQEIAESLDQLFMDIADVKTDTESIGQIILKLKNRQDEFAKILRERDKVNLLMCQHVERLVKEKEILLMHLGIDNLKSKMKKVKKQ